MNRKIILGVGIAFLFFVSIAVHGSGKFPSSAGYFQLDIGKRTSSVGDNNIAYLGYEKNGNCDIIRMGRWKEPYHVYTFVIDETDKSRHICFEGECYRIVEYNNRFLVLKSVP